MKAHLTFNLPEERSEFNDAHKGTDYKILLQEVANMLRTKMDSSKEVSTEEIWDTFWQIMQDGGVDPYED